jgi:membrane protein
VLVLGILFLALLYHVSVPVRNAWRYNLPGAVFTMFCWIVGSAALRWVLVATAKNSTSIYGPLATPIAVLLWLYLLSIAVLIGAALNAAFDQIWPQKEIASARSELLSRLSLDTVLPWRGPHDESAG